MNNLVKIANILSRVNMVMAGILILISLLNLNNSNGTMVMAGSFLIGSIILHSYATLQLRKSVLNTTLPLSNQTITGIRLVGFVALFIAIINISQGIIVFSKTADVTTQLLTQKPELAKYDALLPYAIRITGLLFTFFSLSVAINVFISIRLLRTYLASQDVQD